MPTTLDLDDLRTHIGRTQIATDVIHAGPASFLRLALGRPDPEFREGDVLPPAWLALYFLPRVASDALRPDGSPRDTGVVPPLTLPRRMFAGERVRLHAAVRIGETLRRETRLADISVKHGSTGTLVFATVTSRVYGPNGLAIEEERHTVFREEVKAGERNQAPRRESPPSDAPWRRRVTPDPVLLFRFSALTFNRHRIHYDRAWAMEVEGYPGLLVHLSELVAAGEAQREMARAGVDPALQPLRAALDRPRVRRLAGQDGPRRCGVVRLEKGVEPLLCGGAIGVEGQGDIRGAGPRI